MILEVDVGNTRMKWRLVEAGRVVGYGSRTVADLTTAMPAEWPDTVEQIRIANVAGPAIAAMLQAYCLQRWGVEAHFATSQARQAGVQNSYVQPSRMGVDRWLAMLAAYNACHGECCIVDCGSAITVDYIATGGTHEGGYIIPGLRLMGESLLRNTADIGVGRSIDAFDLTPGTVTAAAVSHGVNFAFKALQEKVLASLDERGGNGRLFITGGDGELFYRLAGQGEWKPDLVLDGLALALA